MLYKFGSHLQFVMEFSTDAKSAFLNSNSIIWLNMERGSDESHFNYGFSK